MRRYAQIHVELNFIFDKHIKRVNAKKKKKRKPEENYISDNNEKNTEIARSQWSRTKKKI